MPKAANLPSLNLASAKKDDFQSSDAAAALSPRSANSPRSPRSPPLSPTLSQGTPNIATQVRQHDPAQSLTSSMPEPPCSPGRTSPKQHSRDASKSFFANLMASKSSHKLHSPETSIVDPSERPNGRSRANSKDRAAHTVKRQTSTPDIPRLIQGSKQAGDTPSHPETGAQAHLQPPGSSDGLINKQKNKTKLGGLLTRSRSGKPEDDKKQKSKAPSQLNLEIHPPDHAADAIAPPLRTAPIKTELRDPTFGMEQGSSIRNRSADRAAHNDASKNGHPMPMPMPMAMNTNMNMAQMPRDGSSLFANIHATGRGVSDRLGKAGRGWLGKMTRSGSSNHREMVTDDNYVCSTINLPLIKQTRKTRIAKRLELSKDKTEFWMPALPWRCIDYLNMQCEQEGLYRVPGSGRDVKFWQRRFDTEYDINLFDEPELYDVNTIASMFKAWLRDLPDELFPKATQAQISKQCAGSQRTPQLLKDKLSQLPPFNYYLLFAITCHLSLLHSCSDQNKMDYRNLCICFQPCLKIDAFCFQFLVIDWKECWQQGCWTEKQYLEEEYRYEKEGSIHENEAVVEERAVSSSGSSAHAQAPQHSQVLVQQTATPSQPPQPPQRPPGSADGARRPATNTTNATVRPKPRSLSSSTPSHGHDAPTAAVPRLVMKTPEHEPADERSLPELSSLSPIRM